MREVRKRVALLQTTLLDLFVATSKRNRLERQERNLLRIVERETDRTNLIVVDAVTSVVTSTISTPASCRLLMAHLHVEEIADLAVAVGIVADSVELQVNVTQTSFSSLPAKLFALGKLDSVRRCLHAVVTDFA